MDKIKDTILNIKQVGTAQIVDLLSNKSSAGRLNSTYRIFSRFVILYRVILGAMKGVSILLPETS